MRSLEHGFREMPRRKELGISEAKPVFKVAFGGASDDAPASAESQCQHTDNASYHNWSVQHLLEGSVYTVGGSAASAERLGTWACVSRFRDEESGAQGS